MTTTARQNQLCQEACEAETQGQLQRAASLFRQAVHLDQTNPTPYLFLGHVLTLQRNMEAAAAVFSLAADLSPHIINAWRNEALDQEVRLRSQNADKVLRAHFTALHQASVMRDQRDNPHADLSRIEKSIWCQTHNRPFRFQQPQQRPHIFYVPGLAAVPIMPRDALPWAALLEDAVEAIRDEFVKAQSHKDVVARPYVDAAFAAQGEQWQPLAGTLAWGSFELYKNGLPKPKMLEQCPHTVATLDQLPVLRVNDTPREVIFSVLQGESHIPSHYGLANTDATVHLPLIVSPQSAIKVMDVVTDWQYGQTFAFDDSYLHESWNHSKEVRVNLLFEVWHPDLVECERHAIANSFAAREKWNASRGNWLV